MFVRGISDYGEPKSKDGAEKDKFHLPSVAAAASFCRYFIESGLRLRITSIKRRQVRTITLAQTLHSIKIERVLISTGDKSHLDILVPFLDKHRVQIITTTKTCQLIRQFGVNAIEVNEYVGCESIVGTRGTLHPYILAAIRVAKTDTLELQKLANHNIGKIDAVFVNANPYMLPNLQDPQKILDHISDIQVGAPALLRWAIRQFKTCVSITSPEDYEELIELLGNNSMSISPVQRLNYLRKSLKYLSDRDREVGHFLEKIWSKEL